MGGGGRPFCARADSPKNAMVVGSTGGILLEVSSQLNSIDSVIYLGSILVILSPILMTLLTALVILSPILMTSSIWE